MQINKNEELLNEPFKKMLRQYMLSELAMNDYQVNVLEKLYKNYPFNNWMLTRFGFPYVELTQNGFDPLKIDGVVDMAEYSTLDAFIAANEIREIDEVKVITLTNNNFGNINSIAVIILEDDSNKTIKDIALIDAEDIKYIAATIYKDGDNFHQIYSDVLNEKIKEVVKDIEWDLSLQ